MNLFLKYYVHLFSHEVIDLVRVMLFSYHSMHVHAHFIVIMGVCAQGHAGERIGAP